LRKTPIFSISSSITSFGASLRPDSWAEPVPTVPEPMISPANSVSACET
jgi:hypothetical protein